MDLAVGRVVMCDLNIAKVPNLGSTIRTESNFDQTN